MPAILLLKDKYLYPDGAIREMWIWALSKFDRERPHGLKYGLFYGYPGRCLVRYDNERGKSDHRHYENKEEPYYFTTVEKLVEDFSKDIQKLRETL
jgi:hypothetical protein